MEPTTFAALLGDWHIRVAVFNSVLIPFIGWLVKRGVQSARENVKEISGEQVDASRAQILAHIDKRFSEHEKCDDRMMAQLREIQESLRLGSNRFDRIEAHLRVRRPPS